MINPIEKGLIRAELTLSAVSAIPVIGTAAGACKIAMGTVQLATALALAILSAIPALIPTKYNPARDLLKFSCRHIVHGAGNVIAGAIEVTPIIQTLLFGLRYAKEHTLSTIYNYQVRPDTHNIMFMKYN